MAENQSPEGNLTAQFRELGKNLTDVLRAAWDQPERKRLQQEIANGLSELGSTLKEETEKFTESPTGQRLKTDVGNVTQRVQSGEMEARVRQELLNALQMANQRIQEAIDRLNERQSPDMRTDRSSMDPASEHRQEVHPDDVEAPPSDTGHREIHPDDVEA